MSVPFSHSQIYFPSRIYSLFRFFSPPYPWWMGGSHWIVRNALRSRTERPKALLDLPRSHPSPASTLMLPKSPPLPWPHPRPLPHLDRHHLSHPTQTSPLEHCVSKAPASILNIFTPGDTHPANLLIMLDHLFHLLPLLFYSAFWELWVKPHNCHRADAYSVFIEHLVCTKNTRRIFSRLRRM